MIILILCSHHHCTGWFFWLVPPRKVLSMELVPPNRKKWLSTLVPPKTHFFQHSRPNHLFKYAIYCSNSDTISHFPPFKNSPTHGNASPSLLFHLEHCSDNHGLLVVVDIVDHFLCMLKELIQVIWHRAINLSLNDSSLKNKYSIETTLR